MTRIKKIATAAVATSTSRPARVLIVPDKFKGTLTAQGVCAAIARGWKSVRPQDRLELLPMSDGGDGFGEVMGRLLKARARSVNTVDAAHRSVSAQWWWAAERKLAVIEAARVIGLAMLPPKKFHPFQLDTFGLGRALEAAAKAGAEHGVMGIGGSATNDGGFGLARGLGWRFLDASGGELEQWWQLAQLVRALPPRVMRPLKITVATDVLNPLLGATGCSRIYGPQKGLERDEMAFAEKCLRRLARVVEQQTGVAPAETPGAGAAGGLGFGLMAFTGAAARTGFDVFAEAARLDDCIRQADLVITGEGMVDQQTHMGKGVGQVMLRCQDLKVRCLVVAGDVGGGDSGRDRHLRTRALTEITTLENAKREPARHLESLSRLMAHAYPPTPPHPA
jgi:glycerate kinase